MNAVVDPRQADAVNGGRRRCPLCGSTSRRLQKKADEPIAAPKGSESRIPQTFSSANWPILGVREGGHDALGGPLWPAPLRG